MIRIDEGNDIKIFLDSQVGGSIQLEYRHMTDDYIMVITSRHSSTAFVFSKNNLDAMQDIQNMINTLQDLSEEL